MHPSFKKMDMKIIGTGSALPSLVVTNDMLSEFLDTNNDWIVTRTGINQRRIISNETLVELAASAAMRALENAKLEATDIDFIICANVANQYVTPGLSCIIQGEIGAKCPCVDINSACSGFLFAMDISDAYIKRGTYKNVLIICADELSKIVNWNTRDTSVLFGDGAGAIVVSQGDNLRSIRVATTSAVEPLFCIREIGNTPFCKIEAVAVEGLSMNGKDVYKMAVNAAINDIKTVMTNADVTQKEISLYLLHQANLRILETIREYLEEKDEKFPKNIHKYGNTSAASIPILLDEMNRSGQIKKGNLLVMCAFGAGFSSGACVLEW